ncbi:MAG TPA: DedA family protein [Solirubrobacterales bacterium]
MSLCALGLISVPSHLGYLVLFALIAAESAGVPLPGETALFGAGVLARSGELDILVVILVAAAAAILGDNLGYLLGRRGARAVLLLPGPLARQRAAFFERGEPFFQRHGPKAVFLGRFVSILRIGVAWLAGMHRMRWRTFFFWNALGGIAWATLVGMIAYALGEAVERLFAFVGVAGVLAVVAVLYGARAWGRRRRDALADAEEP